MIKKQRVVKLENDRTIHNISAKLTAPDARVSRKVMTKYEYSTIIGARAEMFARGVKPNTPIPSNILGNFIEMARYELHQKKTPFIIRRRLPNGKYEEFNIFSDQCELSIIRYE